MVVPIPQSKTLYYIFTADNEGQQNGLCYSILDMSLENGFGDITTKNVQLYTPTTEKITAVRHRNRKDIWLVSHGLSNNTFYSYLITEKGLEMKPVVCQSGHIIDMNPQSSAAVGYMKASPNGEYLGLSHSNLNLVELFNFNSETGLVDNPVCFPDYCWAYGLEFSKDSKKMYFTSKVCGGGGAYIYQIDLSIKESSEIVKSVVQIQKTTYRLFALQLAPNGKIYISKFDTYLPVINHPEKKRLDCDYEEIGIQLKTGSTMVGLPTFMQSYFDELQAVSFSSTLACGTEPVSFKVNAKIDIQSILWDFGDGKTSDVANAVHAYSSSGSYQVTLTVRNAIGEKLVCTKQVDVHERPKALTINYQ